jgi:hypothetical protein
MFSAGSETRAERRRSETRAERRPAPNGGVFGGVGDPRRTVGFGDPRRTVGFGDPRRTANLRTATRAERRLVSSLTVALLTQKPRRRVL